MRFVTLSLVVLLAVLAIGATIIVVPGQSFKAVYGSFVVDAENGTVVLPDVNIGGIVVVEGPFRAELERTAGGFLLTKFEGRNYTDVIIVVRYDAQYIAAAIDLPSPPNVAVCRVVSDSGSFVVNATVASTSVQCPRIPVRGLTALYIESEEGPLFSIAMEGGRVQVTYVASTVGRFTLVNGTGTFEQTFKLNLRGKSSLIGHIEERSVVTWRREYAGAVEINVTLVDLSNKPIAGTVFLNGTKYAVNGSRRLVLSPGRYIVRAESWPLYLPYETTMNITALDSGKTYTLKLRSIVDVAKEMALYGAIIATVAIYIVHKRRRKRRFF